MIKERLGGLRGFQTGEKFCFSVTQLVPSSDFAAQQQVRLLSACSHVRACFPSDPLAWGH